MIYRKLHTEGIIRKFRKDIQKSSYKYFVWNITQIFVGFVTSAIGANAEPTEGTSNKTRLGEV